ncbi:hypothetical protein BJF83_02400 [Nocardiopsis sp. CNR-923]|uniref:DUF6703 family protein n=1 Tax=Nocardiopsis sp. CNR-923 TaxID=1904965 RepID=UPI0009680F64|nr:DUF6703 family protein [Nocardiopsis sp. CNR-923]OLT27424.1 hypothetical protein BJF83_02400 [Nocardiopsis sp. CNR-923]
MVSPEHGEERRRDTGRPLPDGDSLQTPGAGRLRQAVEARSAVPLVWLYQCPRWLPPLVLGVLFIAGLTAPWWIGAPCLLLVLVFLLWLAYLAWPSLHSRQRAPRVLMAVVVAVLAAARLLGF